jgi:hypothetical protein
MGNIKEHMEVVGSDGQHVGRVDCVQNDGTVTLARQDPASGGSHHNISKDLIDQVEGETVRLRVSADQARSGWKSDRQS